MILLNEWKVQFKVAIFLLQEPLDQHIQQEIVTELKTSDKLRESLDVVDIIMGLLSSGGGDPKQKLKKYIDSRKMSRKSFSAKASVNCC